MAWGSDDAVVIAKWLGFNFDATDLARIQTQMDALTNLNSACVDVCTGYLTRLAAIATDIDAVATKYRAGSDSNYDGQTTPAPISYLAGEPLATLASEGTRYTYLLAEHLGLVVQRNWFTLEGGSGAQAAAPVARRR